MIKQFLVFSTFAALLSSTGWAATVTFEAASGLPFSYSESGLNFTVTTVGDPGNNHLHADPGDNGMTLAEHTSCCSNSAVINYDGGTFTPLSFYLDGALTDPTMSGRFVGSNGFTLTVTGASAGTTISFGGAFDGISSLDWFTDAGDLGGTFAIDNFDFVPGSAAPEPSSLVLMLAGAGLVLTKAVRRSKVQ